MEKEFQKIWQLAAPCLRKAKKKDFVLHTVWVVKSMELLLKKERGERCLLIPAAVLHDVGWVKVPKNLQASYGGKLAKKALELHLKNASPIAQKILRDCGYGQAEISEIISIILSHKFKKPRNLNKRLLIDADTLSDIFRGPFYSDAKYYKKSPQELYEFRKDNRFYTKTAQKIFKQELAKRYREINH